QLRWGFDRQRGEMHMRDIQALAQLFSAIVCPRCRGAGCQECDQGVPDVMIRCRECGGKEHLWHERMVYLRTSLQGVAQEPVKCTPSAAPISRLLPNMQWARLSVH